jgi:DNA invertase Pin-like site-specific DNA recombinase
MKTAIYTRVSKNDGKMDPENQLQELKAFCDRQGWEIVEVYTDFASGKKASDDRAAHKRMMGDASKRKFDVVLFWALDRFSREGTEATLRYIRILDDYGVGFRSYQEQYIDSAGPFKDVFISLSATFAKQERIRISERTLAGLAKARLQGRVGGRPKVEDDPKLMAKYQKLRDAGLSVRKIAAELEISPTTVLKLKDAA